MHDNTSCILKWLTCSVSLWPTHVPRVVSMARCASAVPALFMKFHRAVPHALLRK